MLSSEYGITKHPPNADNFTLRVIVNPLALHSPLPKGKKPVPSIMGPQRDSSFHMGSPPPAERKHTLGMLTLPSPEFEQSDFGLSATLSSSPESKDSGKHTLYSMQPEINPAQIPHFLELQYGFGMQAPPSPSLEPKSDFGMLRSLTPSPEPKSDFGMLRSLTPSPEPKSDFGMLRSLPPSPEPKHDFGMLEKPSP